MKSLVFLCISLLKKRKVCTVYCSWFFKVFDINTFNVKSLTVQHMLFEAYKMNRIPKAL